MKIKFKYKRKMILIITLLLFTCFVSFFSPMGTENIQAASLYKHLKPHVLTTGEPSDYNKAAEHVYQCDGERLIPVKLDQNCNLFLKIYAGSSGAHSVLFFRRSNTSDLPVSISCICREANSSMYYGEASTYLTKGTYYMQLPEDNYRITAYCYPQNNRALKTNTWVTAYSDYDHPTYLTYKPKSSGYLTLYENSLIDTGFSAGVTLCNSKNIPIVNTMSNHNSKSDKIVYALKKGTTYKVKIGATDPDLTHYYRLKAKFTKCTEKSGSSKKKAVKIAFGKSCHGMVYAEDSRTKADWYKIANSKTQKIKILYSGSITSGSMKLDVYRSDGKKFKSYAIVSSVGETNEYVLVDKNGKNVLPKGTYYFRITKSREKASGVYSLKMQAE